MGFDDSFSFLTGNSTDEDRERQRVERARKRWERNDGAERNARFRAQFEDPSHPNYKGPGYVVSINDEGRAVADLVDPDANQRWRDAQSAPPAGPSPETTQDAVDQALDIVDPNAPRTPRAPTAPTALRNDPLAGLGGAFESRLQAAPTRRVTDEYLSNFDLGQGGSAPPPPPATAPEVDRSRVDPLVSGIESVQQKLLQLEQETRGMSAAEAALHRASREADLRAAFATEQSARGALGAARGARNRGDRALLERQAVGEAGFMAQEAARTQALSEVAQTGQLAQMRATEEDAERRFRADLLGKAADLGLNIAALEVDIGKADLGSATNFINNQFDLLKQQGQLDLGYAQLDQQKAESVLGFVKDMATLQYEYDKLSVEDQNFTDQLLMQKYGIDQQTMVALKQIKEQNRFRWDQVLTAFVGGSAAGATEAIATSMMNDNRKRA